jgi:hypothetical protein
VGPVVRRAVRYADDMSMDGMEEVVDSEDEGRLRANMRGVYGSFLVSAGNRRW